MEYQEKSEKIAEKKKKEASDPDLISISDSLARIARAFEVIAINMSVQGFGTIADDQRKAIRDYIQNGTKANDI